MRSPLSVPCLALSALLLVGCRGPSGECTGSAGTHSIDGELGGETKLVLAGGLETNRIARMVLDYGDGALFVETETWLPAHQEPTSVPFGPGTPQRPLAEGFVSRFRIMQPEGVPALRSGVMRVELASQENLKGSFDVELEDDSTLHCSFDVTGKTNIEDDQVPIEPPLGPLGTR